ncbi:hypothetical protein FNYG_01171 [Fusarium nygamai]|uniref:Uncharacterized protein n=1 Tax=Gibberella nygamai TaxID=42673 RepID=A0A2K0WV01_GIBNY|nr:hypothetical protein FNYG_01171 [Fusarium nygamai]
MHSCAGAGTGNIRAAKRLRKTLAEVDGLFAGFTHLDEPEPVSRASRSSSRQDDLVLELDSLYNTSLANSAPDSQPDFTDPRNQARENACASDRTVREGMKILWGHLVDVFRDVNLPTINNISAEHHDAQGLRQVGHGQRFVYGPGEYTWIECLGDFGRYRMAIEDDDIRDREVWTGVSRHWYSKAILGSTPWSAMPLSNASCPTATSSNYDSHS